MSPKIPSLATAGLMVLGLFEGSSRLDARPVEAPGANEPAAPTATATPAPAESKVLLKSSGEILKGVVLEDSSGYTVQHRIGIIRLPRRSVVGVFRSVEEVYEYKLGRMPRNDPDERLKLAVWCLGQKMNDEAREQLEATLALNPENKQAKAMLFHLKSGHSAPTDAAVARTSLEMTRAPEAARPRELPRRALDEIYDASRRHPTGPPEILNLPPAQAARRYMEFGRYVHVELQARCAKCHDADRYKGDFRLVQIRSKRDLQNDLLVRTNLDATLRLLNPDDLAHSELLTVSALTHPPDGRPVLGGPNHPSYRVFRTWVANLNDRGESTLASKAHAAPAVAGGSRRAGGPAFGAARRVPPATAAGQTQAEEPGFYTPPASASVSAQERDAFTQVAPGVPESVAFPEPVAPGNLPGVEQLRSQMRMTPAQATQATQAPQAPQTPQVPQAPQTPQTARPTAPARRARSAPAAPVAGPGGATPKNGDIVTMDDGSKAIFLNGQYIPYLAKEDQTRGAGSRRAIVEPELPQPAPAGAKPGKSKPKLDPAALQKFMSGGKG